MQDICIGIYFFRMQGTSCLRSLARTGVNSFEFADDCALSARLWEIGDRVEEAHTRTIISSMVQMHPAMTHRDKSGSAARQVWPSPS